MVHPWCVEVVEIGTGKVIKRFGPQNMKYAEKLQRTVCINLDRERCFTRTCPAPTRMKSIEDGLIHQVDYAKHYITACNVYAVSGDGTWCEGHGEDVIDRDAAVTCMKCVSD